MVAFKEAKTEANANDLRREGDIYERIGNHGK